MNKKLEFIYNKAFNVNISKKDIAVTLYEDLILFYNYCIENKIDLSKEDFFKIIEIHNEYESLAGLTFNADSEYLFSRIPGWPFSSEFINMPVNNCAYKITDLKITTIEEYDSYILNKNLYNEIIDFNVIENNNANINYLEASIEESQILFEMLRYDDVLPPDKLKALENKIKKEDVFKKEIGVFEEYRVNVGDLFELNFEGQALIVQCLARGLYDPLFILYDEKDNPLLYFLLTLSEVKKLKEYFLDNKIVDKRAKFPVFTLNYGLKDIENLTERTITINSDNSSISNSIKISEIIEIYNFFKNEKIKEYSNPIIECISKKNIISNVKFVSNVVPEIAHFSALQNLFIFGRYSQDLETE